VETTGLRFRHAGRLVSALVLLASCAAAAQDKRQLSEHTWLHGRGKVTLDGFDAGRKLGLNFDNVVFDPGSGGTAPKNTCSGRFVPFPMR
jgi:hypothetical protein